MLKVTPMCPTQNVKNPDGGLWVNRVTCFTVDAYWPIVTHILDDLLYPTCRSAAKNSWSIDIQLQVARTSGMHNVREGNTASDQRELLCHYGKIMMG